MGILHDPPPRRSAISTVSGMAALTLVAGLTGCIANANQDDDSQEENVGAAAQALTEQSITITGSGSGGPVRDTTIYAQFPTYNYGSKTTIEVGKPDRYNGYPWGPDDRKQGLLRFDLAGIPAGAYITSATLSLKVSDVLPNHGAMFGQVYAHFATDNAWVDTSVTWTSFGQKYWPGFSRQLNGVSQGSTATVDVKDFVQAWVSGAKPNFGLVLEAMTVIGNVASFVSSEGPAGQRPKLDITYYTPLCAPNPCQNGGSCSQNADTYTCSCPTGYSGTNCEIRASKCVPSPCANGTCVDDASKPEGYTCNCPPGVVGPLCQYSDICAQVGAMVCRNGGTCNNVLPPFGSRPYTCTCANGYSGGNCQIAPPPPYCACDDSAVNPAASQWRRVIETPGVEFKPANWYATRCLSSSPNDGLDITDSRFWVSRPSLASAIPTLNLISYINGYYKNASNYCSFMTGQYTSLVASPGVVGVFDQKASDPNNPNAFAFCTDYSNGALVPLSTPEDSAGCRQQIASAPHLVAQTLPDLPLPIALGAPGLLALAEMIRRRAGKKVAS